MARIIDVAQYICEYYQEIHHCHIDELKLQKLLYFCQRENMALLNEALFNERLEGWVHGPVSPEVRAWFNGKFEAKFEKISPEEGYTIKNVVNIYGSMQSRDLEYLSHQESSWKKSRNGLSSGDKGNREILLEDIREDAQKVRPFDYAWGMYYDEFEDVEVRC